MLEIVTLICPVITLSGWTVEPRTSLIFSTVAKHLMSALGAVLSHKYCSQNVNEKHCKRHRCLEKSIRYIRDLRGSISGGIWCLRDRISSLGSDEYSSTGRSSTRIACGSVPNHTALCPLFISCAVPFTCPAELIRHLSWFRLLLVKLCGIRVVNPVKWNFI